MREEMLVDLRNFSEVMGNLARSAQGAGDLEAYAGALMARDALQRIEAWLRSHGAQLALPGQDAPNNNKQEAKPTGKRRGRKPKAKEEAQPTLGLSQPATAQEPAKETVADKPDKKNGGAKLRAVPSTEPAPAPEEAS